MCDPVTGAFLAAEIGTQMAIMTGVSVASAGMGVYGQNQSAKAQFAAQDQSNKAAVDQQYAASSTELGERVKQGRIERARMQVAGGEAGIGLAGGSFEAAIADSFFQQDEDAALINSQSAMNGATTKAQAASNAASVKTSSYLGAALQIGTVGASGYQSGLQIKNKKVD